MGEFSISDALDAAKDDTPIEAPEGDVVAESPPTMGEEVTPTESEAGEEGSVEAESITNKDPEPEVEPVGEDEHKVPLHHLLQERQSRQELQKELDRMREEFSKFKDEMMEKMTPPKPEFDEDPKGYVDGSLQDIKKKRYLTKDDMEGIMQENQQKANNQALQNALAEDSRLIGEKHSDFSDALQHTREYFYKQHLMSGIPADQIPKLIAETELNIAKEMLPQGKSPSEFVYNYAVDNLGYKPRNGANEERQDTSKIDTIKKGQQSSTPVPSGDAGTISGKKSGDVFDEAFDEAFDYLKR